MQAYVHVYVLNAGIYSVNQHLSTPHGVRPPQTMGEDVHSAADAGTETLSLPLATAEKWVWQHSDLTLRLFEANLTELLGRLVLWIMRVVIDTIKVSYLAISLLHVHTYSMSHCLHHVSIESLCMSFPP